MAILKDLIIQGQTKGLEKIQAPEFVEGGVSLINKYLTSATTPAVNNGYLSITTATTGMAAVGNFSANQSTNTTIKLHKVVATGNISDLNNDSYFITSAVTAMAKYATSANVVTALNNKVDKVTGKGLSTNDYTTEEKTKLGNLASTIATTSSSGYMSSTMVTKLDTITNYLPLSGGIMTGAIKRYYGSASDDPTINVSSLNQDVWIWRVSDGSYNYGTTASYGFGLKYLGTGTGINNSLAIYADNQAGSQIQAAVMNQSGVIDFKTNITKSGYTIWHAGNDGSGSGLDADLLDGKHASAFSLSSHTHSNYIESATVVTALNNCVHITGTETITGAKTFTSGVTIQKNTSKSYIYLDDENECLKFSFS